MRLRPALIFKGQAATGIRRQFIGPLLPNRLVRPGVLPVLPYPGMLSPIMNTARAREQLGWEPRYTATETLKELLDGLRQEQGMATPPLDPQQSGPLRAHEFTTGVGGTDR